MIKRANKDDVNVFLEKYFPQYNDTYDPFEAIYVYEHGSIIGIISLSIIYERSEINYLLVKEENRNNGIGTKLLEYVFDIMNENGVVSVSLEVDTTNNKAINLYKKFGFKEKGIRKRYYGNNDAYLMIKDLR